LNGPSPSLSDHGDPFSGGSRRSLANGRFGDEFPIREASGLAAEIIGLFEGGGFSFWEWEPMTNRFSTYGALNAPTLDDWLLRVHPRDHDAFTEFLHQDWNFVFPCATIDYRLNAGSPGDWIKVRHTLGPSSGRKEKTLSGLVEELSSTNFSRTLLERAESGLREGELRLRRFLEGAASLEVRSDPMALLELLRNTLHCETAALVRLDSGLVPTEVVQSNLGEVSFPFEEVRNLLTKTLAAPSTDEFNGVAEFDLDPSVSAVAWFSVQPVRLAGGRIAGALCTGYRTASARIASRRFRSLLPLAASFAAGRFEREIEEVDRRDLLAHLRESRRLSGVGRITGTYAHGLKNLFTVIEGHLHHLHKAFAYVDLESGRDSLRQLCEAAERANEHTSRLLCFSGTPSVEPRACDLNRFLERFVGMMRPVLGNSLEIRLDLDPAIPPIRAEENLLRELLLNLILSARDAMPAGKVVLSTRSVPPASSPDPVFVSLDLTDQVGPGHSKMVPWSATLFPLAQSDPTGSGLGLFHLSSILSELGGRIEPPETHGAGHPFRLLFPTTGVPEAEGNETRRRGSRPGAPGSSSGPTILLVEDEAAVRKLVRKLLTMMGYEVIEAASGREALDRWPEIRDRVTLVVSDVVMPEGVSGWDLTRELHHRHPNLGILLTSGYNELPADHGLGGIPQIEFLQKPCGVGELKDSLSRLVNLATA
jgi:CheY-like chemotaxis protein/nitrogen-specific signal transduction histidine kinase